MHFCLYQFMYVITDCIRCWSTWRLEIRIGIRIWTTWAVIMHYKGVLCVAKYGIMYFWWSCLYNISLHTCMHMYTHTHTYYSLWHCWMVLMVWTIHTVWIYLLSTCMSMVSAYACTHTHTHTHTHVHIYTLPLALLDGSYGVDYTHSMDLSSFYMYVCPWSLHMHTHMHTHTLLSSGRSRICWRGFCSILVREAHAKFWKPRPLSAKTMLIFDCFQSNYQPCQPNRWILNEFSAKAC